MAGEINVTNKFIRKDQQPNGPVLPIADIPQIDGLPVYGTRLTALELSLSSRPFQQSVLFVQTTPNAYLTQANGVKGRMDVPYRSIRMAIDASVDGDTIIVLPGGDVLFNGMVTYADYFYVTKNVNIVAFGHVTLRCYAEVGWWGGARAVKAVLEGFRFHDCQTVCRPPQLGVGPHQMVIKNCEFTGYAFLSMAEGTTAGNSGSIILRNCRWHSRTNYEAGQGFANSGDSCILYDHTRDWQSQMHPIIDNCYMETAPNRPVFAGRCKNTLGLNGKLQGVTEFRQPDGSIRTIDQISAVTSATTGQPLTVLADFIREMRTQMGYQYFGPAAQVVSS